MEAAEKTGEIPVGPFKDISHPCVEKPSGLWMELFLEDRLDVWESTTVMKWIQFLTQLSAFSLR